MFSFGDKGGSECPHITWFYKICVYWERLCCRKGKLTLGCATDLSAGVYIPWKEPWEILKSDLSEQLLWKLTHTTISNWGHCLKCSWLLLCYLSVDPGCFKVPCTHSLLQSTEKERLGWLVCLFLNHWVVFFLYFFFLLKAFVVLFALRG